MEKITIKEHKKGGFTVKQGDREADGVGFDELMGLIAALTMPEKRPCLHWMQTKEQRKAWLDQLKSSARKANQ